jgi:hypothetical protein
MKVKKSKEENVKSKRRYGKRMETMGGGEE